MPTLPARPSLQHLRKQAKALRRERDVPLHRAQDELARSYGFASWPRLVRHVQAAGLEGIERAVALAEPAVLAPLLDADPAAAMTSVAGLPPLLALLRRSTGTPADVRRCSELLLDTGADPGSRAAENGGEWCDAARAPHRRPGAGRTPHRALKLRHSHGHLHATTWHEGGHAATSG